MKIVRPHHREIPWQLLCLDPDTHRDGDITRLMRVAKEGDSLLGGYLLEAPVGDSRIWQVLRLAVAESKRRQGLGYWLIGHATGVAESRGASEIHVGCREDNPACRLFRRYGYEPVQSDRLCFFTYSE